MHEMHTLPSIKKAEMHHPRSKALSVSCPSILPHPNAPTDLLLGYISHNLYILCTTQNDLEKAHSFYRGRMAEWLWRVAQAKFILASILLYKQD